MGYTCGLHHLGNMITSERVIVSKTPLGKVRASSTASTNILVLAPQWRYPVSAVGLCFPQLVRFPGNRDVYIQALQCTPAPFISYQDEAQHA